MDFKLSDEVAQDQLSILFDYYDLCIEDCTDGMAEALKGASKRLIKSIRRGNLEISQDDGLTVTQNLVRPPAGAKTITFRVIDGKAKIAMADKKDSDNYGKIYAMMGSLSGIGETGIKALRGQDLSLVESLGTVFLAV